MRAKDQTYITCRPRACGMRILGASLSNKSVMALGYHPGPVLMQTMATATAAAANARLRALERFQSGLGERGYTPYGLAAAVFTRDITRWIHGLDQLRELAPPKCAVRWVQAVRNRARVWRICLGAVSLLSLR